MYDWMPMTRLNSDGSEREFAGLEAVCLRSCSVEIRRLETALSAIRKSGRLVLGEVTSQGGDCDVRSRSRG